MGTLQAFPGVERLIPFMLFALYLITSVQICRYSSWVAAGAPNPFLPRKLKAAVAKSDIRRLVELEIRSARSRMVA